MLFPGSVSLLLATYSHAVSTKHHPVAGTGSGPLSEVLDRRLAVASPLCITVGQNLNVLLLLDNPTPRRTVPRGNHACLWLRVLLWSLAFFMSPHWWITKNSQLNERVKHLKHEWSPACWRSAFYRVPTRLKANRDPFHFHSEDQNVAVAAPFAHSKKAHGFRWGDVFQSISYNAYSGGQRNVLRGVHTVPVSETVRAAVEEGLRIVSAHCFTLLHWQKSQIFSVWWQRGLLSRWREMCRWGDHTGFKSNFTSALKASLSSQHLSLLLSSPTAGGVLFVAQEWWLNNDAYHVPLQSLVQATITSFSQQSCKPGKLFLYFYLPKIKE